MLSAVLFNYIVPVESVFQVTLTFPQGKFVTSPLRCENQLDKDL